VYQLFAVSTVVIAERSSGECFPKILWGGFMASKTVWIVGGVVVAIGAIAYVSYKAPAGKDAAGTIVEAKRARADGTNSFNPSPTASTTEQNASDASKTMAGPDAAKDAAGAAAGSGDALRGSGHASAHTDMDAAKRSVAESADAAAAANSGASDNIRQKARLDAAKAMDAAGAASSHSPSNLRGAGSAATSQSAIQQQSSAEAMKR
jgi:hypothetical protein